MIRLSMNKCVEQVHGPCDQRIEEVAEMLLSQRTLPVVLDA